MKPEEARRMVRDAVRRGDLVRPSACNRCGSIPSPTVDGRASIQGHHHDYSKPLDVEWVCAKCHRAETPLPKVMGAPNFGEKNAMSRLKSDQVIAIKASPLGCRKLGLIYGVDKKTIQRVRNGTHWKDVQ